MKIWTRGSSPWSGSRNAWTRIENVNGASRLINFGNFFCAIQMNSCRDWWRWTKPGPITTTRRQSNNQWSVDIAAHLVPKNSECKNPLENFSPRFFGVKTASSSLIIFQRAKLTTRSSTRLCRSNWRTFGRETLRESHQGGLVLARKCPASPGTCSPVETGLPGQSMSWSPTLFSGSGPVRLTSVPWTEKQLKGSDFSSDAEVIAAA